LNRNSAKATQNKSDAIQISPKPEAIQKQIALMRIMPEIKTVIFILENEHTTLCRWSALVVFSALRHRRRIPDPKSLRHIPAFFGKVRGNIHPRAVFHEPDSRPAGLAHPAARLELFQHSVSLKVEPRIKGNQPVSGSRRDAAKRRRVDIGVDAKHT
jgi:hypothetical protein